MIRIALTPRSIGFDHILYNMIVAQYNAKRLSQEAWGKHNRRNYRDLEQVLIKRIGQYLRQHDIASKYASYAWRPEFSMRSSYVRGGSDMFITIDLTREFIPTGSTRVFNALNDMCDAINTSPYEERFGMVTFATGVVRGLNRMYGVEKSEESL